MHIGFYLYLILNIIILFYYYKKDNGIYEAPFMLAYTSVFVMLPQLAAIYSIDQFNTSTFPLFIYTIIGGNIAFIVGFEYSDRKKIKQSFSIIEYSKIRGLIYICTLLGFYSIFTWSSTYQGSDNVVQAKLLSFGAKSLCLISPFLLRGRLSIEKNVITILSLIPIVYFAFFVKGSRGQTLFLVMLLSFVLYNRFPSIKNKVKKMTLLILVMGAIASASIGLIRYILVGNPANGEKSDITELSLFDTYISSFSSQETGFDLGNAVIGIEWLDKNKEYDLGVGYVWDDFIQNNVPRRWVGTQAKEGLKLNIVDDSMMIERLTNSITTMTGYYYAYRSFGILSPLLFLMIGLGIGYIWNRSRCSMFYQFMYLTVLSQIPLLVTHGPGYIYGNIEFVLIFMYPFIFKAIRKVKTKRNM
mgnify:CR=1 FL=1